MPGSREPRGQHCHWDSGEAHQDDRGDGVHSNSLRVGPYGRIVRPSRYPSPAACIRARMRCICRLTGRMPSAITLLNAVRGAFRTDRDAGGAVRVAEIVPRCAVERTDLAPRDRGVVLRGWCPGWLFARRVDPKGWGLCDARQQRGGAMSPIPRRLRWSVLVMLIVLVVAACGTSATSPGGSAASPAASAASPAASESAAAGGSAEPTAVTGAQCASGATEVKFWTSHTPPDSDALTNIVNAFNTANPTICVKMTIVPGAETDVAKLLTAIRGGVAPDVYMADRFTVPQRAAEGVLAELPADVAAMSSQYLPFAWAETQFQGKTYALPFDTDARALWYNKDLITAAGEDPATLDIAKGATHDRRRRGRSPTRSARRTPAATTTSWAGCQAAREPAAIQVPSIRVGTTPGASSTAATSPTSRRAR